jgi:hypothetical protein
MKEVGDNKAGECTRQEAVAQQTGEEFFHEVWGLSLPTGSSSREFLVDNLLFPPLELSGHASLSQAKAELKSTPSNSETASISQTASSDFSLDRSLPHYTAAEILAIKPEVLPRNFLFRAAGKELELVEQLKELKADYESKYDAALGYIAEIRGGEAKLAIVMAPGGQSQAELEAVPSAVTEETVAKPKGESESEVLKACIEEKDLQFYRELLGLNKEADQAQIDDRKMNLLYQLPPVLNSEQKEAIREARVHGLDENLPPETIQANVNFRSRKEWSRVLAMPPDSSLAEIRDAQTAILDQAQQGLSPEEATLKRDEIVSQWQAKYIEMENPENYSAEVIEATYNSLVQIDLTQDMNLPDGTKWETVLGRAERLQMRLNPDLSQEEYSRIRKARLLQMPDDTPGQALQDMVHEAEAHRAKIVSSCFKGKEDSVLPYNHIAW